MLRLKNEANTGSADARSPASRAAMGSAIKTPLANGMAELTRPRDWRIGRATKPIPASRWTPPWNDRANASPAPRS